VSLDRVLPVWPLSLRTRSHKPATWRRSSQCRGCAGSGIDDSTCADGGARGIPCPLRRMPCSQDSRKFTEVNQSYVSSFTCRTGILGCLFSVHIYNRQAGMPVLRSSSHKPAQSITGHTQSPYKARGSGDFVHSRPGVPGPLRRRRRGGYACAVQDFSQSFGGIALLRSNHLLRRATHHHSPAVFAAIRP